MGHGSRCLFSFVGEQNGGFSEPHRHPIEWVREGRSYVAIYIGKIRCFLTN